MQKINGHEYLRTYSFIELQKRGFKVFSEVGLNNGCRIDLIGVKKSLFSKRKIVVGVECLSMVSFPEMKRKVSKYYYFLDKIIFCGFEMSEQKLKEAKRFFKREKINYEIWIIPKVDWNIDNLKTFTCRNCYTKCFYGDKNCKFCPYCSSKKIEAIFNFDDDAFSKVSLVNIYLNKHLTLKKILDGNTKNN